MHQLKPNEYQKIAAIVDPLAEYNWIIPAVLEGVNPGTVYVDDVDNPSSVFMRTEEGSFFAGDPENTAFIQDLNRYFHDKWFNDKVTVSGGAIYMVVHSEGWAEKLDALLQPRIVFSLPRFRYVCSDLKYTDWQSRIPDGYTVREIDAAMLKDASLDIPDHVRGWIDGWGSVENFLANGFGFCTLHGNKVVSWSLADCTSGRLCEIGIHTRSDYRRKGLAAISAAAAVDDALFNGYTQVGWQCNEDNIGSYKTAEKVGFERVKQYMMHFAMWSSVQELAQKAWFAFKDQRYQDCADVHAKLFAITGDDVPSYITFIEARAQAALGQNDQAIELLNKAIDKDWSYVDSAKECQEFDTLRGTLEWDAALIRLQEKKTSP
jgi:hypothetical protein